MIKFSIQKNHSHLIPCIAEIPEGCRKIVILIHGILSSKESSNASFMMRYFSERGIGSIAYDQPGHGTEAALKEPLSLKHCLESLSEVEAYLNQKYPESEICYFASSFGAYVLGIYLSDGCYSGHRAFMRCAAVHFPQIVIDDLPENAEQQLKIQGFVNTTIGGREIQLTKTFLTELRENSLIDRFDKALAHPVDFFFVHGEQDPVVSVQAVKDFTQRHNYPLLILSKEGHTVSDLPESPSIVADRAYQFFMKRLT